MKGAFWDELPHHLAGLASWSDVQVARCAARCLQQFEKLQEDLHHPLARLFLGRHSGSMREHVVAMADGAPRSSRPRFVQIWIAVMRFWPILEISIESKHAKLTKAAKHAHNSSPAYLS